jgi:hypothetical protein
MTAAGRRVSRFVFDRHSFFSSSDSTRTEGTTRVSLMELNYRRRTFADVSMNGM